MKNWMPFGKIMAWKGRKTGVYIFKLRRWRMHPYLCGKTQKNFQNECLHRIKE